MEIKTLIKIFKKCIPAYQKAVDNNYSYYLLQSNALHKGLCNYVECKLKIDDRIVEQFKDLFLKNGYYKNFVEDYYLFQIALFHLGRKDIEFCIKPRLEFLKQQILELENLAKQGYTHV